MKNTILFFLISLIISTGNDIKAQHLAGFSDLQKRFFIFDAGTVTKVEELAVLDFQVGGDCVAYIANNGTLKAYHENKVYELESGGAAIKYKATDYLLGWKIYDFLKVFDDGEVKTLCTATRGYEIQDSLIAWYDYVNQGIYVYYQNEIILLEDGLLNFPVDNFKAGDNIVAYITTFDNKFKAFYQGNIYTVDNLGGDIKYAAGRDILAWMDMSRNTFKAAYKGEVFELEYFAPKSFKVGDGIMAYIDNMDNFKFFKEGFTDVVLTYQPEKYEVQDQAMVFIDQGYFKTWCDNRIQTIEFFTPTNYRLDWNTIAYIDQNKNIVAVQNCEKKTLTYEIVNDIDLIRDLIIYNVGVNTNKIYYFGQVFEQK